MALSLYRKYRPETFNDVMGQEHVETTLRNAVETGKISHAYLFCGPRGTGKTTTARLLAKALLCEKAPTGHPDGSCEQCRAIADGLHPDVYELDAASRTGVENVREEIIGRVQFAPTRGAYKIYIIDEVHMLSTAAFNALLKTLEEPPAHVLFVLCTTDPHKVPPTIQSRCQRFDFHRLSEQQIIERLAHIGEQEGYTVEPEALSLIAQRSQGGMRDAIGSLEQVAVFGTGIVSFEAAESMLGEVSTEQLFSVAELVARRDVAACFAWVASFTQGGTDIAQFVRDLSGHVRNVYIASVLEDDPVLAKVLEADDVQTARYREQAERFDSSDRLAHVLVVLGDLSVQLRSVADARLALEIALTRMARPDSDLTLESLAARIAVLEYARPVERPAAVVASVAPAAATVAPAAAPVAPAPAATPTAMAVEPVAASVSTAVVPEVATPAVPSTAPSAVPPSTPVEQSAVVPAEQPAAPPASAEQPTAPPPSTPLTPAPAALTADAAHRLWLRVEKELAQAKKHSVSASLGGSSAHLDDSTGGLLVELPGNAAFAKQNLERPENRELLRGIIERLHGVSLPLSFVLGPNMKRSEPTSSSVPAEIPLSMLLPAVDESPAFAPTSAPTPIPTPAHEPESRGVAHSVPAYEPPPAPAYEPPSAPAPSAPTPTQVSDTMPDYFEYAAATDVPAPAQIPDTTPAADASSVSLEAMTGPSGMDSLDPTPSDKQEMDSSALADIFSASFGTQVTVHEVDTRD